MTMKPQEAALLLDSPGGNLERRMEAMMKVRQFPWRGGEEREYQLYVFFSEMWKVESCGKGKEKKKLTKFPPIIAHLRPV